MENNILGIETSGSICSVALYKDNSFYEINQDTGLTHSETLFLNIKKLLSEHNINVNEFSYIAVSNGPGSYTGLRIGVSCALGLSICHNIKIKYVNTLKSLLYNIEDYKKDNDIDINYNDLIVSILDAKAYRVYLGLSQYKDLNVFLIEKIVTIDELIDILYKYDCNKYLLGDGSIIYNEELSKINNIHIIDKKYSRLNAKNIIIASQYDNNFIDNLDINYMQKSQAERNRIKNV